jgi:hypothetical protein
MEEAQAVPSRRVGFWVALMMGATASLALAQGVERVPVRADQVDISDRPDATSYTIARLIQGEEVTVIGEAPNGWLVIDPPPSVFLWIPEDSLDEGTGTTATVTERDAITRVGRPGSRRLGPESLVLPRDTVVTLNDRQPLIIGKGRSRQVWVAIEPPLGFRAYVRAQGIDRPIVKRASSQGSVTPAFDPTWERLAGDLVRTGSPLPESSADPLTRSQAMALQADHRAALSAPLTMWRLDRIRDGYRDLAGRTSDPTLRDALNRRVRLIQLQEESSAAARRFADQAQRSKGEDLRLLRSLGGADETPGRLSGTAHEPYDATGMLMPSSKLVDGDRVYALIGTDGFPAAYLKLAPGIGGARFSGAQVGVRGPRRYDGTLRADVIDVNDLEPLSDVP